MFFSILLHAYLNNHASGYVLKNVMMSIDLPLVSFLAWTKMFSILGGCVKLGMPASILWIETEQMVNSVGWCSRLLLPLLWYTCDKACKCFDAMRTVCSGYICNKDRWQIIRCYVYFMYFRQLFVIELH